MNEEQNIKELPEGWEWEKFGSVVHNLDGKRIPLSKEIRARRKGQYRYYGATEIVDYIDDYIFEGEHLLVGEDGANLLTKAKALAFIVDGKFWVNNHAHVLKAKSTSTNKYLCYYFNSLNIAKFVTGTAQPKLTQGNLNKIEIPLPTLLIQQTIVSKIEELFSELDKGIENLRLVQQQLKTYRQSVLKWAFEGVARPSISFSEIVFSYQNGISKRNSTEGKPFKVLRLADIKNGEINSKEPREIKLTKAEIEKYKLTENDIIAIRVNGSKELVGKFVLVKTKDEWAFCDHFIKIRLDNKKALPRLIKYYAESRAVRRFIELNMVSSAGQNTISQTTLSSLEIKLPPIEVQQNIVQAIEGRLSVADKMEESIIQSLQQAEALRQSILKNAFEGRL